MVSTVISEALNADELSGWKDINESTKGVFDLVRMFPEKFTVEDSRARLVGGSTSKDEDNKENDLQAILELKGIELNENDKEAINDNDGEVANEPLEIPKVEKTEKWG